MDPFTNPQEDPYTPRPIRGWITFWNSVVYVMLLVTTILALADPETTQTGRLIGLGFALLFSVWYWVFIVHLDRWGRSSPALAGTFALMITGLAAMTLVSGNYYMLLFSLYGVIFSVLCTRYAVMMTIYLSIVGASVIIISNGMRLDEIPGVLIGFGISTFFGVAMGLFITAIMRQSAERQKIINELTAARADLARAERQAGIFEERQRLAREIHDTLAQGFTSIVMHLEAADQALPQEANLSPVRQHLDRARETARESLSEARRFVWALRNEPLEREPLGQAIRRVADRWADENKISAQVEITGPESALPSPYEVALLRTAQEALANISKHAQAQHINLTLTYMDDQVILDVQDDGQGFDPNQPRSESPDHGFGLMGMRERAELLGGTLNVESAPGEGATLVMTLPLAPQPSPIPEAAK